MIYVCPEKDCQVYEPCKPCICGMDKLKDFGGTEDAKPRVSRAAPIPSTGETARSEDVAVPREPAATVPVPLKPPKEFLERFYGGLDGWGPEHSKQLYEAALEKWQNTLQTALACLPRPDAGDMAAFGASEYACYKYPGEDQAKERAAFCEGAAQQAMAPHPTPTGDVAAKLAEIRKRHGGVEKTGLAYLPDTSLFKALDFAHLDRAFLLPIAERAAALEQIMRNSADIIAQFVRTNNEGNEPSLEPLLCVAEQIRRALGEGR